MYIKLRTINVWKITGDLDERQLFDALPRVCEPSDILVIGASDPIASIRKWLTNNALPDEKEKPFFDENFSWEINKIESPYGRSYSFHPTAGNIQKLIELLEVSMRETERCSFFDHLLLYRPGLPTVPLVDFHDAFSGGILRFSEIYSKREIDAFLNGTNAQSTLVKNPDDFNEDGTIKKRDWNPDGILDIILQEKEKKSLLKFLKK